MSDFAKCSALAILISVVLSASACGSSAQNEASISTAVAQTVQAGQSLTEVAIQPTVTPGATIESTSMPATTPTSAPTLASAPSDPNCVGANLVGENPPDGALLQPGEYFWKTWTLLNTGTCTWDSSYKLIFWSGELMGGLISYPLPIEVLPNEQKDISIYLKAPDTDGTFTGYWQLQTPWNANFGVGLSREPFYVQVVVSSDERPDYEITSVTYDIVRDPPTGCPTNVLYKVYATITTNGPIEFSYYWDQSDGNESAIKNLIFTEAGSRTISREWMVGKGDSPNTRWMQIIVTGSHAQEYEKASFENTCP
ncbi:MAG TPA: NBR1-Ig-like domain-containing protein [Anaerolineales bacterium]|nr:NBR1-Ig-like domain-containing protein [Anaerolineales bacterium]